jgi:hypothetical protein
LKPWFALAWPCLLLPATTGAQTVAPLAVDLSYEAPADCPDAQGFRAQVRGRTARVTFAEPSQASDVGWTVVIRPTASGTRGTLRVTGAQLEKLERHVTAATCDQVVSALALGAALSVDPEASLVARSEPEKAAPRPEPKPEAARRPSKPKPRAATRLALGLSLTARSGMAADLVWTPRPFAGLSVRSQSGHTWGMRLSATQTHGSASSSAGQADLAWSMGRLEVFPVRFGSGLLRFEPALFVEAGQLRARGVAVTPVNEVRRPVLLAGALGRLSLLAFDLLLLELEAGPALPVIRDRFYVQENTTVFSVPAWAGFAAAGVGLEFL